jgi:oligopeptide transport system substrate-binding protein
MSTCSLRMGRKNVFGFVAAVIGSVAGLATSALAQGGAAGSGGSAVAAETAKKVMPMAMRTDGPKSLDPAQGSTQYDNIAVSLMYETLVTFKYSDPKTLEPLLLEKMPEVSADGLTYTFTLKEGVKFHDNACFPDGKGRLITPEDFFYSLKRLADPANGLKNWWLLDGVIAGFDEWKEAQIKATEAGGKFDYNAPVSGMTKTGDRTFTIKLNKPVYRFLYTLAQFQTSIVAREAVEKYGKDISFNPVGTGPFVLDKWEPKQFLHVNRNVAYHPVKYPAREEWSRDDRRRRLDRAAGQSVPFVDRVEFTMFVQDQPMWLQFNSGTLGYIEVPNEYFEQAFDKRTKQLLPELTEKGISNHADPLLDFIFDGFNMVDPLLGGYTPEKKALRQAISLATDLNERNEAFYSGLNVVYDGPIPPGLDGHPEGGRAPKSYRGPDLEKARAKLAEAGWPGGKNAKGEQLVIRYFTSTSLLNQKISEMQKRQMAAIGIDFQPVLMDFSTLIENVNNKKAPMFGFAWGSDYPDGENNLALFYSPNESPGSNHYNYKNPAYDKLYEQILPMAPSPERTKIYEQMRDMLLEDVPYVGSMARTRHYLMAPWMLNCRPTERTWSWIKYLDVDPSKQGK